MHTIPIFVTQSVLSDVSEIRSQFVYLPYHMSLLPFGKNPKQLSQIKFQNNF